MKYILLLFILIASGDCKPKNETTPEPSVEMNQKEDTSLYGEWHVMELNGIDLSDQKDAQFTIQEKRINATIGCNMHFGSFEVNDKTITVGNLMSTEKYCIDLMELENSMQQALKNTHSFYINDNLLEFKNAEGNTLIKLKKSSS